MFRIIPFLTAFFIFPLYSMKQADKPYAFPNPFHASLRKSVRIIIPLRSYAAIRKRMVDIYTGRGVFVRRLSAPRTNTRFVAEWDGRDYQKRVMPAGLYFIHILSENSKAVVFSLMLFR